jgi:hypothetical protein
MLRMCVYMHSRFVENHPIWILKDGPLISEVVLSHDREPLAFCMRCYACKKAKFLLSKRPTIESPLLFILGATHVENLSFC